MANIYGVRAKQRVVGGVHYMKMVKQNRLTSLLSLGGVDVFVTHTFSSKDEDLRAVANGRASYHMALGDNTYCQTQVSAVAARDPGRLFWALQGNVGHGQVAGSRFASLPHDTSALA